MQEGSRGNKFPFLGRFFSMSVFLSTRSSNVLLIICLFHGLLRSRGVYSISMAGLPHSLGVRIIGLHCKQAKRMSRKTEKCVILCTMVPEKRVDCMLIFLKKCVRLIQIKYSRVVIDLKRNAISDLIQWKNNPKRKTLVIRGPDR